MSWVDSVVILSWYVWQTKRVDQSLVEFGPIVFVCESASEYTTDRQTEDSLFETNICSIYIKPTKKTPKNILNKLFKTKKINNASILFKSNLK